MKQNKSATYVQVVLCCNCFMLEELLGVEGVLGFFFIKRLSSLMPTCLFISVWAVSLKYDSSFFFKSLNLKYTHAQKNTTHHTDSIIVCCGTA